MKNKALNTFYGNLLEDVGVVDGGSGLLSYHRIDADDKIAITIDGKRLTLPTRENLKLGTQHNMMFHPLSEQLMSGPSPVLDALREYIMLRISTTAASIAQAAMTVAQSVALQKKCKGTANELIRPLAGVDPKMEATLGKVLDNIGMTPETRMYNIFLVASGSKDNPRGLRTTKVSFPIMDDAYSGDETEFFNVKMPRKTKDKVSIVGMMEVLFGIEDKDEAEKRNCILEYTTDLRQAPYFHSLLTAFYAIATHQNALIDGLFKAVPALDDLRYKLEWNEEFEDFENFAKKVGHAAPLLPGNKGKALETEEEEGETRKAVKSSWKDLRDDIEEEEVVDERDIRVLERSQREDRESGKVVGWRDLLSSDKKEDSRSRGVSFGDRGRGRKRSGFESLANRDDRDGDRDGRGGYRERKYGREDRGGRSRGGKSSNWRDLLS